MDNSSDFEILLVCPPGLETLLQAEAAEKGFATGQVMPGGVTVTGDWPEVWRANLQLRGATRVLVRVGSFMAFHLAQLDKRSRKFAWGDVLRPDVPVRVQVTCKASRIYHAKAAQQRIEKALTESHGIAVSAEAELIVKVRIHDNQVTISLDTSGEALHKRGHKVAVGKAPMRENMAALFLRACGYDGAEPVLDPMCGSGTFIIEAAQIAAGINPGRSRSFAFENLASFDPAAWDKMRGETPAANGPLQYYGSDRDQGAIRASTENAQRAGVGDLCLFTCRPAGEISPPDGPPGLVIVNPPYGGRIGNKKPLYALYGSLGETLKTRFAGWRVGLITTEPALAKATKLNWSNQSAPVAHGGLKVRLWQTDGLT